jgi:hypothetical protein
MTVYYVRALMDFFKKLIKDVVEFLRLIHMQPMAGTGDHLIGQVRHKPLASTGLS